MTVFGTHDPALVGLSLLISVAAPYTALDMAGRANLASRAARPAWIAAASLCLGGGIWSMHFVAMLAYAIPGMTATYDVGLTATSLAVAIASIAVGLHAVSRTGGRMGILAAGCLTGLGISAMHAIGMMAMEAPATLGYDAWDSVGAVGIAIAGAVVAMAMALRHTTVPTRLAAATAMGAAIAGMHYVAMAGVSIEPCVGKAAGTGIGRDGLAAAVSAATFVIFAAALLAASFDRRLAAMAERETAALRLSGERLRTLYAMTPLPLHALDRDGRVENVSDAWLALTGYARDEVVGRPLSSFLTTESAARAAGPDQEELLRTGGIGERQYQVVARDGRLIDVVATGRVERDAEGNFLRLLAGVTDVTDRLRAENALRQAQKIEAIGQLTGGVAHDFNNLLAVILGNLDLLEKRIPRDDAKALRFVDGARQGATRGAGLVKHLLAFARKQELAPTAVQVPRFVQGMADMLQRTLGPTIGVETQFPLHLDPVLADENQLGTALLNLAVNARDAMPGGGRLTIAAHPKDAPPGLGGRGVALTVTDTGEGMDAETLRRATEPFFTTKGLGKGTGLGLAMVYGLAAQSGGALTLRSEPGRGTRAELWLPVAEASPTVGAAEADATSAGDESPMRVLVVDDDPLVLASTIAVLEDAGHEVVGVPSGAGALASLRAGGGRGFDIVVSDNMMPTMTGLELARILSEGDPGMPVLIVSGFTEAPQGPSRFPRLAKPFTGAALLAAMRKAVADHGPSGRTSGEGSTPVFGGAIAAFGHDVAGMIQAVSRRDGAERVAAEAQAGARVLH